MPKSICIVSNQPGPLQLIRFSLNMQKLELLEAGDGLAAFELLARRQVDLVVLDAKQPPATAVEFVRRVRKTDKYADLPIIVVGCHNDRKAWLEVGGPVVPYWLNRPFRISEIQSMVENCLGLSQPEAGVMFA